MVPSPRFICLVVAAVLFGVAALYRLPSPPRFDLVAAGLFFLTAAQFFA